MYSAHKTVCIEKVCHLAGGLREFYPDAPSDVADRPFYHGDVFSEMILGSLVHTSTVLLRRTRLALVGGFDESLIKSGEDYEFHLHTCSYGPVGFLDAASILYRIGADDQLSAPRFMLYIARNNLATVRKWLAKGKGRITLPVAAIRHHLAECYDWLGSEKYVAGDYWGGRVSHLQSLWHRPWQPRLWVHLPLHCLPGFVRHGIRGLRRRHARN
jgi:GT2 family glycosyltransferase